MMLDLYLEGRFKKDMKLAKKRRLHVDRLWTVVEQLQAGKILAAKYRPHKLKGEWASFHECHIEPDWLLIYLVTDEHLVLVRTGTHSDLFG
jgi:mRNA interferase YafQ